MKCVIRDGHIDLVKILLDKGYTCKYPLHLAAMYGHLDLVKLFIKHEKKDDNMSSPLHYAKTYDVAKFLIDENFNVNEEDVFGDTPMLNAMTTRNYSLIKLLKDHGCRIRPVYIRFCLTKEVIELFSTEPEVIEYLLGCDYEIKKMAIQYSINIEQIYKHYSIN